MRSRDRTAWTRLRARELPHCYAGAGQYVSVLSWTITSSRTLVILALLLAAMVATASPSSAQADSAYRLVGVESAAASLTNPTEAGLRAAATAFANAFLHGSLRDLFKVLDPACVPKLRSQLALGNAELQGFRRLVKRRTGIDAADIKVRSVEVSNYDIRTGDAQTHYGLCAFGKAAAPPELSTDRSRPG